MRQTFTKGVVVLSVYPSSWGVSYAIFIGPWFPVDWGTRFIVGDKNAQTLAKVRELLKTYRPDVLVIEDYAGEGSRRTPRVREVLRDIEKLAATKKVTTHTYSRAEIRACFSQFNAWTKHEITRAIAESLPEFRNILPPVRKIWMPEHYNMNIFDAVSLVFTFFYFNEQKKRAA